MKKIILLFTFFCFSSISIFSQAINTFGVSVSAGPTFFFGDVSESLAKSMKYKTAIGFRTNLYETALYGKFSFEQGVLGGSKSVGSSVVKFENSYDLFSASLLFEPLKLFGEYESSKFQPYVIVGYGGMWFRAKSFYDGDGALISSFGYKNAQPTEKTCEWVIPHGIGFEYQVSSLVALEMEMNRLYVHSDKLDATVSNSNDVVGTISLGASFTFGGNVSSTKKSSVDAYSDDYDYDSDDTEVVRNASKSKSKTTKNPKTQSAAPVQVDCNAYVSQLAKKDAEIKLLQDSLTKMSNIPQSLKIKYCRKYLNGLLYRKCDDDVITNNLAILDSARLQDENIEKYKYLLRNYSHWYSEFLTVVELAQKDGRRYSPLTSESNAYRNDIVNRINAIGYSNRATKNWQIYYLEDQINLIKKRLDEKVKHPEVIIDFSDLLD